MLKQPIRSARSHRPTNSLVFAGVASYLLLTASICHAQEFDYGHARYVRYRSGRLEAKFDRYHGSAPLEVCVDGKQLISPYPAPGEGFQAVYETRGNDPTQSSHNGIGQFRVALKGRKTDANYYYMTETVTASNVYQVKGYPPFFLNYEGLDVVPSKGGADQWWGDWTQVGTPLYFGRGSGAPAGVAFMGNHRRWNPTEPLLGEIGLVAFQTTVNLSQAYDFSSFAGVLFKRNFRGENREVATSQAFTSTGYSLFVNKAGQIQLWASDAKQPLYDSGPVDWIAHLVNTTGLRLEVRTHKAFHHIFDLHVGIPGDPNSSIRLKRFTRKSTINGGKHLGFFAYCPTGRVGFFDRRVHDMKVELTMTYTAAEDHSMFVDMQLRRGKYVSSRFPLYSATLQAFVDREQSRVVRTRRTGILPSKVATGVPLFDKHGPNFLYAGHANMRTGLGCLPLIATVDGSERSPYASVFHGGQNMASYIHLNAIPEKYYSGPAYRAKDIHLLTQWFAGWRDY